MHQVAGSPLINKYCKDITTYKTVKLEVGNLIRSRTRRRGTSPTARLLYIRGQLINIVNERGAVRVDFERVKSVSGR